MAILDYSGILNRGVSGAGQVALDTSSRLQGLRANEQQMQQNQQQLESQQQAQVQDSMLRDEGARLLQEGTPNEIASFGIKNPEIMKDFITAANFKDKTSLDSRLQYSQNVISGSVDPRTAIRQRIEEVERSGGDAQGLIRTAMGTDAEIVEAAEKDYSVIDPAGFKIYSSNKPLDMTKYQEATIEGKKIDQELRRSEAENKRVENQLKRETDVLKRQELEQRIQANTEKSSLIKQTRDEATLGVVDQGESSLRLISDIRSHPGLNDAVGVKGLSSLFGAVQEPLAGTDAAGAKSLIDTLESQNFITAIAEFKAAGGAGALSDAEGAKLSTAITSLNRKQSLKDFKKSLNVVEALLKKQVTAAKKQLPAQEEKTTTEVTAPQGAVELLKSNPAFAEQFKNKYGYLPEG